MRAKAKGIVAVQDPGAVIAYRYRPGHAAIWRQGRSYGRSGPLLIRRARDLGLPAPWRFSGWRSWAWLVAHLPSVRHRAGRAACLWVLACRIGVLERAVSLRSPYL